MLDTLVPVDHDAPEFIQRLAIVVDREADKAYVEYPTDTPWSLVQRAMRWCEQDRGIVFDLSDEGLWEYPENGCRIHGMFIEELM